MRKRCRTCGGVFSRRSTDGSLYFHACPPVTFVRVKRGARWDRITLRALQPTDTIEVERAGAVEEIAASTMQAGDVRRGDESRDRANRRDENVDRARARAARRDRPHSLEDVLRSAGLGVEDVA